MSDYSALDFAYEWATGHRTRVNGGNRRRGRTWTDPGPSTKKAKPNPKHKDPGFFGKKRTFMQQRSDWIRSGRTGRLRRVDRDRQRRVRANHARPVDYRPVKKARRQTRRGRPGRWVDSRGRRLYGKRKKFGYY